MTATATTTTAAVAATIETVVIEWSENGMLDAAAKIEMSYAQAANLIDVARKVFAAEAAENGRHADTYDKTAFVVEFVTGDSYKGRLDLNVSAPSIAEQIAEHLYAVINSTPGPFRSVEQISKARTMLTAIERAARR